MEICTIGGYEEVGKNMTAVKVKDDVFIFDMGVSIPALIDLQNDNIQIYSERLGHYFIEVVQDPIDEFKYYISTTMPQTHWANVIKPITHPIGWDDVYVEVTGPEVALGTFTVDYKTDIFTLWRNLTFVNFIQCLIVDIPIYILVNSFVVVYFF